MKNSLNRERGTVYCTIEAVYNVKSLVVLLRQWCKGSYDEISSQYLIMCAYQSVGSGS